MVRDWLSQPNLVPNISSKDYDGSKNRPSPKYKFKDYDGSKSLA